MDISLSFCTSDVCYAQDSGVSDLLHATLIWVERTSSGHRTSGRLRRTVGQEGLGVGTWLRRWLLHVASVSDGVGRLDVVSKRTAMGVSAKFPG